MASGLVGHHLGRGGHEHRHRVGGVEVHDGGGDAVGLGNGVVGLDVDHGVHRLGGHGGDHVVHVHAHLLVVAALQAGRRRDLVDEDVADGGAGLVGDLEALELLDPREAQLLACHDAHGLPTCSITAMPMMPPLSWPSTKEGPA